MSDPPPPPRGRSLSPSRAKRCPRSRRREEVATVSREFSRQLGRRRGRRRTVLRVAQQRDQRLRGDRETDGAGGLRGGRACTRVPTADNRSAARRRPRPSRRARVWRCGRTNSPVPARRGVDRFRRPVAPGARSRRASLGSRCRFFPESIRILSGRHGSLCSAGELSALPARALPTRQYSHNNSRSVAVPFPVAPGWSAPDRASSGGTDLGEGRGRGGAARATIAAPRQVLVVFT